MFTIEQLTYFPSVHTAKGYRDLITSNLEGVKHVLFLEGATHKDRQQCMHYFIEKWQNDGEQFEVLLNGLDRTNMTGVINRQLSSAIIDRTNHPDYSLENTGRSEQLIDLTIFTKATDLPNNSTEKIKYRNDKEQALQSAYKSFATGLDIHDQLEKIYIERMDFQTANLITTELIDQIFSHKSNQATDAVTRHRFLGASTATGVYDYIETLTNQLNKRYFIKGRAGTGKSTMLKQIIAKAESLNYQVEAYHCGFDPDSYDMVIIRELSTAIFDSTSPHLYQPSRHRDELIDLYQTCVEPGTDEKYQTEIDALTVQYKSYIHEGMRYLAQAKEAEQKLDALTQAIADHNKLITELDGLLKQ